jgi:hypothetical protein
LEAEMLDEDVKMHIEIRQALARYCHGVDHGDLEMARSAYWPEGTDAHGLRWDGNGHEFVTDLDQIQNQRRADGFSGPGSMHHLTTILVKRTDADHALVQSYFIVYNPHTSRGKYQLALVVGRYLDRFERRDEEWKILTRETINDFSRLDVPGAIWPSASWQEGGFRAGGYGQTDPGVQALRAGG